MKPSLLYTKIVPALLLLSTHAPLFAKEMMFDLLVVELKDEQEEKYQMPVQESDSIGAVKQKIHTEKGIPVEHQSLIWDGQVLDNNRTLASYNIHGASACFLLQYHVNVKTPQGRILKINTNLSATVEDLKEKIYEKKGICLDKQILMFKNRALTDDHMKLNDDCRIKNGDTITLEIEKPYSYQSLYFCGAITTLFIGYIILSVVR